jgi:hypothetical protein
MKIREVGIVTKFIQYDTARFDSHAWRLPSGRPIPTEVRSNKRTDGGVNSPTVLNGSSATRPVHLVGREGMAFHIFRFDSSLVLPNEPWAALHKMVLSEP